MKNEWKLLWKERIDDHVRAEGIAKKDYSEVFVERGTVILATRNFKLMNFRDVLEQHGILDAHKYIAPDPRVGGWGKFVRSMIIDRNVGNRVKRATSYMPEPTAKQHKKKGGRGWMHL